MKLLMFDTDGFAYKIHSKGLEHAVSDISEEEFGPGLVIFLHAEVEDELFPDRMVKKSADNIIWLAKKTGREQIVLHTFAHLSDSRADPGIAEGILLHLQERLRKKGYRAEKTPFGFFLEFTIKVRGESLAKVWKSIS